MLYASDSLVVKILDLVSQPQSIAMFPFHNLLGLFLLITGFIFLITAQITLGKKLFIDFGNQKRSPAHHPRHLPFHSQSNVFGLHLCHFRDTCVILQPAWSPDNVSPDSSDPLPD